MSDSRIRKDPYPLIYEGAIPTSRLPKKSPKMPPKMPPKVPPNIFPVRYVYDYNEWCKEADLIVEKFKLFRIYSFQTLQPLNRARFLTDCKITFEMPEWYELDPSRWYELGTYSGGYFYTIRDKPGIDAWNQHLRKLDLSKINWKDFYVKFNMIFGYVVGKKPSIKFTDSIGENEFHNWSYSTETFLNVETEELHALYNAIDKLQMLLASGKVLNTDQECFENFIDLLELYSTNLENTNRFNDIEVLKKNSRFKIAWSQYKIAFYCFNRSPYKIVLGRMDKEINKVTYIWFIKHSKSIYNVIHPSRKYKWRSKFDSNLVNREEDKDIAHSKQFLQFYYILKIFNSPLKDVHHLWDVYMQRERDDIQFRGGSSLPLYAKLVLDTILGDQNKRNRQGFTDCQDENSFFIAQPDCFVGQFQNGEFITKMSSSKDVSLCDVSKSRIRGEFRNIYQLDSKISQSPELLKGVLSLIKTRSRKGDHEVDSKVKQKLESFNQDLPRSLFIPDLEFVATLNSVVYKASLGYFAYSQKLERIILSPINTYRSYLMDVLERISLFDYDYRKPVYKDE